jgi:hypothetical protein
MVTKNIKKKSKSKKIDKKAKIVKAYAELNHKLNRSPKMDEIAAKGFTKDSIKHYFSSLSKLDEEARKVHADMFFDVEIEDIYTEKAIKDFRKLIKKHKRFIITTAVTGCQVDQKFYASIKTYCKQKDALMLVMVASDPAHVKSKGGYGTIDDSLSSEAIVLEDTKLNSNIFLSTIKLSAKHVDPTTGLDRIGQRAGTFVFASPKQRLSLVATSNEKLPHALMTTGAVTTSNYITDMYMSERTAYIANADHVMGAIIVEIVDDSSYHYRQIQASKDGSFADLGVRYSESGSKVEAPAVIVFGDWHSGSTDPLVKKASKEMLVQLKPKRIIGHDMLDGLSINHHEEHNKLSKAVRFNKNMPTLEQELTGLRDDIDWLTSFVDELVVVKSNHDEFLSKHYLQKAKYADDPQNHYFSLDLAKAMMEGQDPLKFALEKLGLKNKHKVKWLQRDEDFKIADVQLGAHGDKGPNGSRGSLANMRRAYSNSVTGHTHTPGILNGAFSVGTSSYLKLNYNEGPSSWLQTHCIVYADGTRQLINMIDGQWKAK